MKLITSLFALVAICFFVSCKKKETNISTNTITLDTPMVANNRVILKWSGLSAEKIQFIRLERLYDSVNNYNTTPIILPASATEYSDTFMLKPYVQYKVTAQLLGDVNPSSIVSNKQNFSRSDIDFLPFPPRSAICDKAFGIIYLLGYKGEIATYDINSRRITKQINPAAPLGQCYIATHSGRRELYAARQDGWVFIYDAASLELLDQLNVGYSIVSLVYNDGKLFMSTNDIKFSLVSYDRTTKLKLFDTAGNYSQFNLKLLPGSNTELIGIKGSGYCCRFTFDANGKLQSLKSNSLTSFYIDGNAFEFLPSGDKIVAATSGTVINTNLEFYSTFPRGSLYLKSFDMNAAGKEVYCSTNEKEIHVYNSDSYMLTKRLPTLGYPIRSFYYNGILYAVSSEYQSISDNTTCFIERL